MWKYCDSVPRKKFKTVNSLHKIMSMVSWEARDALLVDFLPRGETVSAAGYCNMLDRLSEVEKMKKVAIMAQP